MAVIYPHPIVRRRSIQTTFHENNYSVSCEQGETHDLVIPICRSTNKQIDSETISSHMLSSEAPNGFVYSKIDYRDDFINISIREPYGNNSNIFKLEVITCAKVCSVFSFVGMIFLLIIGILLETQPLYLNGVKLNGSTSNNMRFIQQSFLRNLPKIPLLRSMTSKNFTREETTDGMELRRHVHNMQKETKNAFKASALYFLTMMLSFILVQSPDIISCDIFRKMKRTLFVRRYIVNAWNTYRRKEYTDIYDSTHCSYSIDSPTVESSERMKSPVHSHKYSLRKIIGRNGGTGLVEKVKSK